MPLLIIAGISERSRRQGRQTNWSAFPWPIKFIFTGKDKWAAFSPCIPDLMKELSNAPQDGAHVLAFNNDVSRQTQDALRGRVGDCTHLAFADPELISAFGKQRFTDFVNAHIASENEWRNAVCPTSTWSPLLLPEKTFRAARGVELMWTLTRRSDARPETLAEAALRIREFCDKHERKEKKEAGRKASHFFKDDADYDFEPDRSLHGKTPNLYERWKFSFEIGINFHYDVDSRRRSNIKSLFDCEGREHRFESHLNVDAYGWIR